MTFFYLAAGFSPLKSAPFERPDIKETLLRASKIESRRSHQCLVSEVASFQLSQTYLSLCKCTSPSIWITLLKLLETVEWYLGEDDVYL